jgi:hypothetical protein
MTNVAEPSPARQSTVNVRRRRPLNPISRFLGALPALSVIISSPAVAQHVTDAEARQWQADLKYMSEEMRKWHKNLFHTITGEQFDQTIRDLDRQIPSLARHQIIVAMARIAAMIGDGHTNLAPTRDPKIAFRTYPIKLYFFSNGLHVRAATPEHAEIIGSRIVMIGTATVEEAYGQVRQLIGRDNEMGARFFAPFLLAMPEVLHALGLISDMDHATYTIENEGSQRTIELKPFGPAEMLAPDTDTSWLLSDGWTDARQLAGSQTPLWLKDPRNKFWYEYLPDSRTLYVQFNHVGNKEDVTVEEFSKRLFSFIDSTRVDRLALDLRLNRGGNGQLNLPLLLGIIKSIKIDQPGKLFTIIGRSTWSAAQFLTGEMERYTNTLFVGEPTGGKPNSYGDSHKIILPNSGIAVRVSTLWWQGDERDTREWIAPQIAAELSFEEYRTNTDPALNTILKYIPEKPLDRLLSEAVRESGLQAARTTYNEWKSNPSNKYANVETELNNLGYELLGSHRINDAIGIFQLNVDAYPGSPNVYDSLGEAYMAAGQNELAITSYQKSLELNPKNANARAMIARIEGKNR